MLGVYWWSVSTAVGVVKVDVVLVLEVFGVLFLDCVLARGDVFTRFHVLDADVLATAIVERFALCLSMVDAEDVEPVVDVGHEVSEFHHALGSSARGAVARIRVVDTDAVGTILEFPDRG